MTLRVSLSSKEATKSGQEFEQAMNKFHNIVEAGPASLGRLDSKIDPT